MQKTITAISLAVCALMTMGNSGCKKDVKGPRTLQANVDVGHINGQSVTLPNGEVVDFEFLANNLFYASVMLSDHFTIMDPLPQYAPSNTDELRMGGAMKVVDGYQKIGNFAQNDLMVLERFGFLKQLGTDGSNIRSKAQNDEDIPACVYNTPTYELKGAVTGFSMNMGGGVCIGFGSCNSSSTKVGPAAGIHFNRYKLDLIVSTENQLTKQVDMPGVGYSKPFDIDLNFTFPIGGLPIGFDFFKKANVVTSITKAFDMALKGIVQNYIKKRSPNNKWEEAWEAKVSYEPELVDNDTFVAIRAGSRNSVQPGDRFKIYNMQYKWKGPNPCVDPLDYSIPLSKEPVAIVEAYTVGDNITSARVIQQIRDERIQAGAKVVIDKLFDPSNP